MTKVYLTASLVFVLASCSIFDKEEMVPGFIHITHADLITNEDTEGADTHGIVDVHVFADEDFVGSFELPATIAMLKNGMTTINISAGIKNNGISTQRILYPFMAPAIIQKDLIPGVVLPVSEDSIVSFTYFPDAFNFLFENFEGIGNDINSTDVSDVEITPQSEEVRSGLFSGKITLTPDQPRFDAIAAWDLVNIRRGVTAYLEVDFKGNHPLEIGLQRLGSNPQRFFVLGLNPQQEWTKVYIELTQTMGNFIGTQPFTFYFESRLRPNTPQAEMYLDNIKFLYPD